MIDGELLDFLLVKDISVVKDRRKPLVPQWLAKAVGEATEGKLGG